MYLIFTCALFEHIAHSQHVTYFQHVTNSQHVTYFKIFAVHPVLI